MSNKNNELCKNYQSPAMTESELSTIAIICTSPDEGGAGSLPENPWSRF